MPTVDEIEQEASTFFDSNLEKFKLLRTALKKRLEFILYDPKTKKPQEGITLLDEDGNVRARVKERPSYLEKVRRKYEKYTQEPKDFNFKENITDYVGARIIHYKRSDQTKIKELLRDSGLEIIEEDTHEIPTEQFGYQALHIIIEIPSDLKIESGLNLEENYYAEIQISTVSMHLWSNLSHKVGYKNQQLTKEEMRELYKLAAMCEIVDDIYDRLILKEI